jgi:hypothetical protein
MAGSDVRAPRRARYIWTKLRLKQEFPVTFAEALAPWNTPPTGYLTQTDLPPRADYVTALTGVTNVPLQSQSSACLYLALQQSRSNINTTPESVLNPSELTSVPQNGRPPVSLIVDAWSVPVVFSRWPYKDIGLNPSGAQAAPPWLDPQDPEGYLSDPAWMGTPGYNAFAALCHPTDRGKSYKLQPVIVSAGPDKDFGYKNYQTLEVLPSLPGTPVTYYDNIYSNRIRLGGTSN